MRRPGLFVCVMGAAGLALSADLAGVAQAVRTPRATPASTGSAASSATAAPEKTASAGHVLQQAFKALGGKARLDRVKALEIRRSANQTLRLLFPNCHQIEYATTYGAPMITSFDGQQVRVHAPAQVLSTGRSGADPDGSIRTAHLMHFSVYSLTYLLRSDASFPLTATLAGTQRIGDVEGLCVLFASPAAPSKPYFMRMLFDPRTGLPLAYGLPPKDAAGGRAGGEQVSYLSDYRDVSGIRFPFHIVNEHIAGDGTRQRQADWRHEFIKVDPPIAREAFQVGNWR